MVSLQWFWSLVNQGCFFSPRWQKTTDYYKMSYKPGLHHLHCTEHYFQVPTITTKLWTFNGFSSPKVQTLSQSFPKTIWPGPLQQNLTLWYQFCPSLLSICCGEMLAKSNMKRKGFIWLTGYNLSSRGAKAGTIVKTLEECRLLAYSTTFLTQPRTSCPWTALLTEVPSHINKQ